MTRRYYAPDLSPAGGSLQLSDEEASHAARVMRAQVGDTIELFDGRGNQADATIQSIDKRTCLVIASAARPVDRQPERRLQIGIAFPKPERAKEMIERLTELGVHRVTPIVCQRTQRPPTESLLSKLRRVVIEASKQCELNLLMAIDEPTPLSTFAGNHRDGACWIAHPTGRPIRSILANLANTMHVNALVGPEGGFTDDELQMAMDQGYEPVGLGRRIYRIETAATVVAALLAD